MPKPSETTRHDDIGNAECLVCQATYHGSSYWAAVGWCARHRCSVERAIGDGHSDQARPTDESLIGPETSS